MKNLIKILITSILIFASCAIPAQWRKSLDEWIGYPEDLVYLVYGPPDRSQKLNDGRKIATYLFERFTYGDREKATGQISFAISNGTVEKTSIEGNPTVFNNRIKGPHAKKLFD